jgi:hypothetical protein
LVLVTWFVVATLATDVSYGTPLWWSNPSRLHWCGRSYAETSTHLQRSDIPEGQLPGDKPYVVSAIGTIPPVVGRQILAAVTPKTSRDRFSPPLPCTMALYLQSPGHGYVVYGIEGGP